MTRKFSAWTALVLIMALLAGCGQMRGILNVDPHAEFDRRYDDLKNQQPSPARDAALLQLARDANEEAGSTRDTKDKINFHSRAATYAWAANTEEALIQVILSADAGYRLCQSFPDEQRKPGRDCALLAAYGPVASGESALSQIETSKPDSPTTTVVNMDSLRAIDGHAERFKGVVVRQWPTAEAAIAAPEVPEDTAAWFAESKRRQWCRFYWITNQAKRWKLDPSTRAASRQVRTRIAGHYDAVFAAGKDRIGVDSPNAAFNLCAPYAQPSQPSVPAL